MQSEVPIKGPGEGKHDGAPHVGVLQPDAVADLVGQGLEKVHAPVRVQGPVLRVIHMNVSDLRVVGMGQGPSWAVKRIPIQMVVCEEIDGDINFSTELLVEEEVSDITPVSKGFLDRCNNFVPGKLGAVSVIPPTELILRCPLAVSLKMKRFKCCYRYFLIPGMAGLTSWSHGQLHQGL